MRESEPFQLKIRVEEAEKEGIDLLIDMASNLEKKIDSVENDLQKIIKGSFNNE